MNIFGVGGAELIVIIVIMLIVAGPQRMLKWAYVLGQWMGKLRQMWKEVMVIIQAEIDQAGIDVKLPEEMPTRQNITKYAQEAMKPYADKMREAEAELRKEVADVEKDVRSLESETKAVASDLKKIDKDIKDDMRKVEKDTAPKPKTFKSIDKVELPKKVTPKSDESKDTKPSDAGKPEKDTQSGNFGAWGSTKKANGGSDDDTGTTESSGPFGTWSQN